MWARPRGAQTEVPVVTSAAIASIQATILAVFLAAISAYALYVYQANDQLERRVLAEAEEINGIAAPGSFLQGSPLAEHEDILLTLTWAGYEARLSTE